MDDEIDEYSQSLDIIREMSLNWNSPLSKDQLIVLSAILGQDEENLERFKKLPPVLQERSAINYLNLDSFTPFTLYLSAIEDTNGESMPGISTMSRVRTSHDFYNSLDFATGRIKRSPEFIACLRWFDYYLGRSSSLLLYTLRSKYGQKVILEMTAKLSEYKIDPRVIDFVSLIVDWDKHDLNANFSLWVKEVYRYRTLSDEGMDMIPL